MWKTLLLFVAGLLHSSSVAARSAIVKENALLTIQCPRSQQIIISHALYGLPQVGNGGNCRDSSCSDKLKELCDHKRSCIIKAENEIFGDPCYGIKKRLQVEYDCVDDGNVIVEENAILTVECPREKQILISNAVYGPLRMTSRTDNCEESSCLEILKDLCDAKNSCSVKAENDIFGDPCHGTKKRLQVKYNCTKDESTKRLEIGAAWAAAEERCARGMKDLIEALQRLGEDVTEKAYAAAVRSTSSRFPKSSQFSGVTEMYNSAKRNTDATRMCSQRAQEVISHIKEDADARHPRPVEATKRVTEILSDTQNAQLFTREAILTAIDMIQKSTSEITSKPGDGTT